MIHFTRNAKHKELLLWIYLLSHLVSLVLLILLCYHLTVFSCTFLFMWQQLLQICTKLILATFITVLYTKLETAKHRRGAAKPAACANCQKLSSQRVIPAKILPCLLLTYCKIFFPTDSPLTCHTAQFKGAGPNFLWWRRKIWYVLWKFDPVYRYDTPSLWITCFHLPLMRGVDIHKTKLSNLVILSYIVAFKKSIKMLYYCSIASLSRNSMLPSLPIFI